MSIVLTKIENKEDITLQDLCELTTKEVNQIRITIKEKLERDLDKDKNTDVRNIYNEYKQMFSTLGYCAQGTTTAIYISEEKIGIEIPKYKTSIHNYPLVDEYDMSSSVFRKKELKNIRQLLKRDLEYYNQMKELRTVYLKEMSKDSETHYLIRVYDTLFVDQTIRFLFQERKCKNEKIDFLNLKYSVRKLEDVKKEVLEGPKTIHIFTTGEDEVVSNFVKFSDNEILTNEGILPKEKSSIVYSYTYPKTD